MSATRNLTIQALHVWESAKSLVDWRKTGRMQLFQSKCSVILKFSCRYSNHVVIITEGILMYFNTIGLVNTTAARK